MAINYCDFLLGDDTTGDGTSGNPYKTITKASTGLGASDEVRCAKSVDPTLLSEVLTFTFGSLTISTAGDLTGELSVGDFIGKGTDEYWYEIDSINTTTITLKYKYAGTSETVSGYKLNLTDTGSAVAVGTVVQEVPNASKGTSWNTMLSITGGWDLSTETQTGWTNFYQSGVNRYGMGLYHVSTASDVESPSYIYFGKLRFLRYNYGFSIRNATYVELEDITCLGNQASGYYTDRYYIRYSVITNLTAIGNVTNGVLLVTQNYYNTWKNIITCSNGSTGFNSSSANFQYNNFEQISSNLNGANGMSLPGTGVAGNVFRNIQCSYNTSIGFWSANANNMTNNFLIGDFSNNGSHGLHLVYWFESKFIGITVNNNGGSGAYFQLCRLDIENAIFNNNASYGIEHWNNNGYYPMHLKNVSCEGNGIQDFFGSQNYRRPTQDTDWWTNCRMVTDKGRIPHSIFENFNCPNVLINWTATEGGTGDTSLSGIKDLMFQYRGIVSKHIGAESRGGEGSCIKFEPRWADVVATTKPSEYTTWSKPLSVDMSFYCNDNATDKKITIFLKRTSDFSGIAKLAITGADVFYLESEQYTLEETYTEYSLILPKENIVANEMYRFFILVFSNRDAVSSGSVYADDFAVTDIEV